jgi:mono/diheme cytochrome c family protein
VRAFITSITPPKYPFPIDASLAEHGRGVFEKTCATCHGTYGETPSYPNKLVPLAVVGTDPLLASGTAQFGGPFVDWYKTSFFGELSRLEPKEGYVAPPLDGIWATAPYLHNGSVPTIAALLDSTTRPRFWKRSFDSNDYDAQAVGWNFTPLEVGKVGSPKAERPSIYDTTRPGYGNAGHAFGDVLSEGDRTAVIEYLKTL